MSYLGQQPRRIRSDGLVDITCRSCGRIVSRRPQGSLGGNFSTITKCAICMGAKPENVLPQYIQIDPTKPPVPVDFGDPIFVYEEEEKLFEEAKRTNKPWLGLIRPLFRALGFKGDNTNPETPEILKDPVSRKVAAKKRSGGLFEPKE